MRVNQRDKTQHPNTETNYQILYFVSSHQDLFTILCDSKTGNIDGDNIL